MLRPTPGDPWGVEQHHWNTGAEENQQLNPGETWFHIYSKFLDIVDRFKDENICSKDEWKYETTCPTGRVCPRFYFPALKVKRPKISKVHNPVKMQRNLSKS